MKGLLNSLSLSNVNEILLDLDKQKKYVLSSVETFNRLLSGWASLLWTAEGKLLSYLQAMIERAGILCDLEYYTHPANWYWAWQDHKAKAETLYSQYRAELQEEENASKAIADYADSHSIPVFPQQEYRSAVDDAFDDDNDFTNPFNTYYGTEYYNDFVSKYPDTIVTKECWTGTSSSSTSDLGTAIYDYYYSTISQSNYDATDFPYINESYGGYRSYEELTQTLGSAETETYFKELHNINHWLCETFPNYLSPFNSYSDTFDEQTKVFNNDMSALFGVWEAKASQAAATLASYSEEERQRQLSYDKWVANRESTRKYIWGWIPGSSYNYQYSDKWVWDNYSRTCEKYGSSWYIPSLRRTTVTAPLSESFTPAVVSGMNFRVYAGHEGWFYEDEKAEKQLSVSVSSYMINLAPAARYIYDDPETELFMDTIYPDIPQDLYGDDFVKWIRRIIDSPEIRQIWWDPENNKPMDESWWDEHIIGYDDDDDPIYADPADYGFQERWLHKFTYLDITPSNNLKGFMPDYGITDWLDKEYPGKQLIKA